MKKISWNFDYKSNKSNLCELGRKYDTDKSSQREHVKINDRHCHPYTLFYNSIFENRKNDKLNIAEIGILNGSSLLMWKDYFPNSDIFGFEYDNNLIKNFKNNYNNERITLSYINVKDSESIIKSFFDLNLTYDIILDDSTHVFEDQIRIIENVHKFLKPGGVLIIEDIFIDLDEGYYMNALNPILENFQDYYFVTLDHENKFSGTWRNDKLLILIKNGVDETCFKKNNKLTIITTCNKIDNLEKINNSINFDYVEEWIIIYDQSKLLENPIKFNNIKIKEFSFRCNDDINIKRYALSKISNEDTFLIYLNDNYIINLQLYNLLDIAEKDKFYTFNKINESKNILSGDILTKRIEISMILIYYNFYKNIFDLDDFFDDDEYILKCYLRNKNNYIFIKNNLISAI